MAESLCGVDLLPAGHQAKACCPLHAEATPSFYVNDGKGAWHCFGCKAGGDSIALVRAVLHQEFVEALETLAGEAGIDIQEYQRPPTPEEAKLDELRAWCERWLMGSMRCDPRVGDTVSHEFGVYWHGTKPAGVIPPGVPEYALIGTIFPYRRPNGRLVGWKTRTPDGKQYGTPNDFPLAEPTLFGIQVAREHITDRVCVVEGEYDTLACHEHGYRDVVGLGGSAVSDEQIKLLEDLKVREASFLFDGDEAGLQAADSTAKRYWRHPALRVRVGTCPAGADPEDVVRAGMDLPIVPDALEWLLLREFQREPREKLGAKLDFVKWVREHFGHALTGLEETMVLKTVATWLDVPEANVLDFARSEQTLLQAPDSEKVVLGRCCREQPYYVQVRKRMARDDFYVLKHQRLWQVLEGMLADNLEWDDVLLRHRAGQNGIEEPYVDILLATGDLNIGWHEDQVIEMAVRRGARADADRFREVIADLSVPANQLIGALTHQVTSKALGRAHGAFRGIVEQVDEAVETLHERMKNPDTIVGLDVGTQFPNLMRTLQGFQPRRLGLITATSGRGKSTMGLQFFTSLAVAKAVPCDFVSLEMDADEILFKAASHLTGIDSMKITSGQLSGDELQRVEQAMLRVRNSPLRIYTPDGITPSEFVLYARESVMERRTEIFCVDYAQMVGPDPEDKRASRYEQLGTFAYACKQKVARALDTSVICMAQLKREAAQKEEPTPEDIGDSYELVRAADWILLINETEAASEGWVGKNRQGPGGVLVPMRYDKPCQTFAEDHSGAAKRPDYGL